MQFHSRQLQGRVFALQASALFLVTGLGPSCDAASGGGSLFTKMTNSLPARVFQASYSCAWGDYNNDGRQDLFVGNAEDFATLYRNDGDGVFVRVTGGPLLTTTMDASGIVVADIFNRGLLDVYIANYINPSSDAMFRGNSDGTFSRVSLPADTALGLGATLMDFDRDGHLDIAVANGFQAPENEFLYRNNGDGSFTKVEDSPLLGSSICCNSQGIFSSDVDNDGWPDVFVANYNATGNTLFRNVRGEFAQVHEEQPAFSGFRATTGAAFGDFDNDGFIDLALANYEGPVRLLRNLGGGAFERFESEAVALDKKAHTGIAWADVDNNGWLDLYVAGVLGNLNHLYLNHDGRFTAVTDGDIAKDGGSSVAPSFADYDNDGHMDLYVANAGTDPNVFGQSRNYLYHNNGSTNAWVMFNLVGSASNRSAIGARVRLRATIEGKALQQTREVSVGGGWSSPNELRVHFGLGNATRIDSVEIDWPSGTRQAITNPEMRRIHQVVEPPRLEAPRAGTLRVFGTPSVDHEIHASDDLKTWKRIGIAKGGTEFVDAEAPPLAVRFYRALDSR